MAKKVVRYGVIRPDGSWVFEPRYAHLGIYHCERVPFSDDGARWGFADASGAAVVAAQYGFAYNFVSGAAAVEVAPGRFGSVDAAGASVELWRGHTREERYAVCRGASSSRQSWQPMAWPHPQAGRWGYADASGQPIVDPIHLSAHDFAEGYGAVRLADGAQQSLVVPTPHAYFDRDGAIAIGPFDAYDARTFANGRARIKGSDGTWYFIDTTGAVVLRTPYREMSPFREDRAVVTSNTIDPRAQRALHGYIDLAGNAVTELIYESAGAFSHGMAAVSPRSGITHYGYIDATGATVIEPRFRNAHPFGGRVAPVAIADPASFSTTRWGLIDHTGAWVAEPTFAGIAPFAHGVAKFVRDTGDVGLFDGDGAIVADHYAHIDLATAPPFPANRGGKVNGKTGAVSGGTWGFLHPDGTEALPFTFDAIASSFAAGFGFATVGKKG